MGQMRRPAPQNRNIADLASHSLSHKSKLRVQSAWLGHASGVVTRLAPPLGCVTSQTLCLPPRGVQMYGHDILV